MKKYNIGWGLTNACNMNCQFCYSKETRNNIEQLGIEDWKRFIDQNSQYVETINYGTGENAILDDFFEFIDYVRKNYPNITQSLTTNRYLYEKIKNNSKLYNIYKDSIDEVDVSLDFAVPEKHTIFRGQPKAYEWAINTLQMLKKDNKKSTIVFIGTEETLFEENIINLFKLAKKYNAILRMNIYRPVSKDKKINEKFILSYETLMNTIDYIDKNYSIISINDVLIGNIFGTDKSIVEENTGVNSIRILPNGDICPSTYLITDEFRNKYNIKQNNVLETLEFDQFINAPIPEECKECKLVEKCKGGVFDRRILWHNSLLKRDPYCPFENNDNINKKPITLTKKQRVSVHDGYIPTMFFEN